MPPGYLLLKQTTYNGYMSLRLVLKDNSAANLQKAVEYVKQIKVYPLSQANNPPTRWGYVDIDNRALLYNYCWGSVERLGNATYYLNLAADGKGQPLDGSPNYRLNVPANAPVKQFWSATTQSDENGTFMDVSGRLSLASTDEGVVKNPDGSVDVYFGPEAPKGHESNWVQTEPDKHWFIMFRFYGTKPAVYDKSWRMGDIETLN